MVPPTPTEMKAMKSSMGVDDLEEIKKKRLSNKGIASR